MIICNEQVHTEDKCNLLAEHYGEDVITGEQIEMRWSHEFVSQCLACIEDHMEYRRTEGDYMKEIDVWAHGPKSTCHFQDCIDEQKYSEQC